MPGTAVDPGPYPTAGTGAATTSRLGREIGDPREQHRIGARPRDRGADRRLVRRPVRRHELPPRHRDHPRALQRRHHQVLEAALVGEVARTQADDEELPEAGSGVGRIAPGGRLVRGRAAGDEQGRGEPQQCAQRKRVHRLLLERRLATRGRSGAPRLYRMLSSGIRNAWGHSMHAMKLVRSAVAGAALALLVTEPAWAATAVPVTVNPRQEASMPGKFIWFDGVTDDPAASEAFYGAVFGWTFQGVGTGEHRYTLIRNGEPQHRRAARASARQRRRSAAPAGSR